MTLHFDDQFPSFREVDGLSDTAFRLHVTAFFWIRTNRTDGLIRLEDLALVCARVRAPERFAAECVQRGAWHDARHDCGSPHCLGPVDVDGFVVHDYLKENPSRADLEAEEAGKSRGGRHGNHKRWHEATGKVSPGCEFCEEAKAPSKRTSHNRSHTDRISDNGATPIDLDQIYLSPSKSKSRSKSARARGPEPRSQEFRLQVIAAFAARCRVEITAEAADAIAEEVLAGRDEVDNRLLYVLTAIENDPDPVARWLPRRPAAEPEQNADPKPKWCGKCIEADHGTYDENDCFVPCPACHPKFFSARRVA